MFSFVKSREPTSTHRSMLTFRYFCRSPSIKVTRVRHDDSTSNLVRHVKACDGGMIGTGSGSITAFAQGSTYTPHKLRMKLAIWVARRHRPFAIVEDDELRDIFTDLNNKVEVPSRFTVSRDVKEIFDMSRVKVAAILKVRALIFCFDLTLISPQAHPGKLHLCADGWTSPNVISFIGLTVHWAGTDGNIGSTILDFVKCVAQFLTSDLDFLLIYLLGHQKDIRAATLLLASQNVYTNTVFKIK